MARYREHFQQAGDMMIMTIVINHEWMVGFEKWILIRRL